MPLLTGKTTTLQSSTSTWKKSGTKVKKLYLVPPSLCTRVPSEKAPPHTLGIAVEEEVIEEEGEEEDDEDMSVDDEEGEEGGEFEGIDEDEFEAGKSTPPLSKIHLSEVSPGLIYSYFHCSP